MKTVLLASASGKSSTTMIVEDDRSESRDSCYFPGCRKDANCKCEICLASINATLDLMPTSYQKSSLTKISASRPNREVERTPISFNSSNLSTPSSSPIRVPVSPVSISSTRLNLEQKMENNKGKWRLGGYLFRLILVLSLIFSAHFGSSWVVSGLLRPVLSADIVRNLGERSWVVKDLRGRLRFVQRELQGLVDGEISNCSNANSNWEIDQDGLLLSSRCTLYKTATEEVSVWGWPLQTAGLLTAGFSSRSFTILSGRVTEWSDGSVGFLIRKGNTSWVQKMLDASVVQLNPETWVLEYRRSLILDNSRLFSGGVEFLKHRISRMVGRLKQEFWLFPAWENYRFSEFTAEFDRKIPT